MSMSKDHGLPSTAAPLFRGRKRARFGAESREQRRRMVTYALLLGTGVLMVHALVGENGYLAGLRAQRQYASVMSDYMKLRVENQQLIEQARRLKDDPSAIEDSARRQLGLIRPGETLVIIRDTKPTGK
jgi:cell division protein FtsB